MQEQAIWDLGLERPSFPQLSGAHTCDVAIIGGGITGVTAALLLKQAGKKVILLEAAEIGSGVTGATTAHLTTLLDERYADLIKTFGAERAGQVAASVQAAIATIERLSQAYGVNCDFTYAPGYLYAEPKQDAAVVADEIVALRRLNQPVSPAQDLPLGLPAQAALRVERQALFHPLKYLFGLVQKIAGDGSAVYTDSRVTEITDGEPCVVRTEHGEVRAAAVILATHVPTNELFLTHARVAAYRSYVLALAADDAPDALLWDVADPYHYTRGATVDGRRVLIVGGDDHKTGQEEDTERPYTALMQYAKDRFGDREVVARWSAQVYEPADGLPYIGRQPLAKHLYMGTGYSGTGMTFGTLAAEILADELTGKRNPYAELYDAERTSLTTGGTTIVGEGLNLAFNAIKSLVVSDGDDVAEVAAGEGKVLRIKGEQVAAYRDEHGALTLLKANCTHLGCVVGWNTAERTWDCPCHGGRFSATGEVLEGPPVKALTPYTPDAA